MSMLTACGGGSEETSTDTAAEEVVEEEDTADPALSITYHISVLPIELFRSRRNVFR